MDYQRRLTYLTRIGFAVRGLLYIVIAVLILQTGRTEDTSGALDYLGRGGGQILLGIMAAGLFAYGLWRLSDAAMDIERHGNSRSGIAERAGAGISGAVHLYLCWRAVRLMQGAALSGGDTAQEGTQTALAMTGGGLVVMVGGALLLLIGAIQCVKAAKGSYLKHLHPAVANRGWVKWSGGAGYAARGLVFLICGVFLLRAGYSERASDAGGMEQALSWLDNPWDILVALGLLGFGIFSLIEARYRMLADVPVHAALRKASRWS